MLRIALARGKAVAEIPGPGQDVIVRIRRAILEAHVVPLVGVDRTNFEIGRGRKRDQAVWRAERGGRTPNADRGGESKPRLGPSRTGHGWIKRGRPGRVVRQPETLRQPVVDAVDVLPAA